MDEHADNFCLFIGSMGRKNSEQRSIAAKLYRAVSYFTKRRGLITIHCDKIARRGKINDRLMKHIIEDKLVIADLSGNHSHIFYQVALRHSTGKPSILIIKPRQKLPFDSAMTQPLVFDLKNDHTYIDFRRGLESQLDIAIKYPQKIKSPASTLMQLLLLKKLGIPQAVELAEFLYDNPDMEAEYKFISILMEANVFNLAESNRNQTSFNMETGKTNSELERAISLINSERANIRVKLREFIKSEIYPLIIKMELSTGNDREFIKKLLIGKLNWLYMPIKYIDFSPYELRICELIADGLNAKQIALKTSMHHRIVMGKIEIIMQKLKVSSRSNLKKYLQKIL